MDEIMDITPATDITVSLETPDPETKPFAAEFGQAMILGGAGVLGAYITRHALNLFHNKVVVPQVEKIKASKKEKAEKDSDDSSAEN